MKIRSGAHTFCYFQDTIRVDWTRVKCHWIELSQVMHDRINEKVNIEDFEGSQKATKDDEIKIDELKDDETKVEEPKVDEPKVDEPKDDEPIGDEPKDDEPIGDRPKSELSAPQEEFNKLVDITKAQVESHMQTIADTFEDEEFEKFLQGDLDMLKDILAEMPGSYLLNDLVFRGAGLQYED